MLQKYQLFITYKASVIYCDCGVEIIFNPKHKYRVIEMYRNTYKLSSILYSLFISVNININIFEILVIFQRASVYLSIASFLRYYVGTLNKTKWMHSVKHD